MTAWTRKFFEIARKLRSYLDAFVSILPRRREIPHEVTAWVFLRMLGVVYFFAFFSLGIQIVGLVGHRGILPAQDYLDMLVHYVGWARFWLAPGLCWFLGVSNGALWFLCFGGAGLSLLLICDVAPVLVLFLLWIFYLSLTAVCRDFMMFQWDMLLLETGFLAIFLAPLRLVPQRPIGPGPEPTVVWLGRWLLFRLVFGSGVVKLVSGDETWRNLTALTYHYQTQPLPTWIGWYAHQLPLMFQKASTFSVLVLELIVPCLFLAPRRFRLVGGVLTIAFQILILITGNYCFFNLLTMALCILLLDDTMWPAAFTQRLTAPGCGIDFSRWGRLFQGARVRQSVSGQSAGGEGSKERPARGLRWPKPVISVVAALTILVSGVEFFGLFNYTAPWMTPVGELTTLLGPFRIINSYGLFAIMTTERPEIIVEGSNDEKTWLPYEFKYKPGDPARRPAFVEPFQPRLDWQMWFAALTSYRQNPWFTNFCARLLKGSPDVLGLLAVNPFPDAPPRHIRALVYDYCFNDRATREATGNWWSRQFKGYYCPVLSIHAREDPASPLSSADELMASRHRQPASSAGVSKTASPAETPSSQ